MGSGSKEPKGPKHKSKKSKHSKKDHRLKAKKKSHKADKRKRKERSTSASSRSASRSPQRRRPISPDRSGEPLVGTKRPRSRENSPVPTLPALRRSHSTDFDQEGRQQSTQKRLRPGQTAAESADQAPQPNGYAEAGPTSRYPQAAIDRDPPSSEQQERGSAPQAPHQGQRSTLRPDLAARLGSGREASVRENGRLRIQHDPHVSSRLAGRLGPVHDDTKPEAPDNLRGRALQLVSRHLGHAGPYQPRQRSQASEMEADQPARAPLTHEHSRSGSQQRADDAAPRQRMASHCSPEAHPVATAQQDSGGAAAKQDTTLRRSPEVQEDGGAQQPLSRASMPRSSHDADAEAPAGAPATTSRPASPVAAKPPPTFAVRSLAEIRAAKAAAQAARQVASSPASGSSAGTATCAAAPAKAAAQVIGNTASTNTVAGRGHAPGAALSPAARRLAAPAGKEQRLASVSGSAVTEQSAAQHAMGAVSAGQAGTGAQPAAQPARKHAPITFVAPVRSATPAAQSKTAVVLSGPVFKQRAAGPAGGDGKGQPQDAQLPRLRSAAPPPQSWPAVSGHTATRVSPTSSEGQRAPSVDSADNATADQQEPLPSGNATPAETDSQAVLLPGNVTANGSSSSHAGQTSEEETQPAATSNNKAAWEKIIRRKSARSSKPVPDPKLELRTLSITAGEESIDVGLRVYVPPAAKERARKRNEQLARQRAEADAAAAAQAIANGSPATTSADAAPKQTGDTANGQAAAAAAGQAGAQGSPATTSGLM